MLKVDLSAQTARSRAPEREDTQKKNIELAKLAQVKSQIASREKAKKRKENTSKRAKKRKLEGADNSSEPETKKKKTEGRLIDFTARDLEHVKRLFNSVIVFFGNINIIGLVCGYDCSFCPALVYPIFIGPQEEKKQSVYDRKFILGVGKSSNVFTGIKQAFTELYPEYPADRVYDWRLMKWNKKAYKAVTANVAVDPGVLSQDIFSSKSFGGTKQLPCVKVTDEMNSARKMECAVEVATYIKKFVPQEMKTRIAPSHDLLSFADIRATLEMVSMEEKKLKEKETEISEEVKTNDVIQEAFERASHKNEIVHGSDSESEEYSDSE